MTVATILHLIGILGITQQCLIVCGTWVGWLILRYFAPNPTNAYLKGNDNEEFELQYLFPPLLRFPVRTISSITYAIFKNVGCCEAQTLPNGMDNNRTKGGGNTLSDNLNDLVLNLSQQQSITEDNISGDSDGNNLILNKYGADKQDVNETEARKRMEAKQLIEQRLQQIQKEYNQRAKSTKGGSIGISGNTGGINNTQNKDSNLWYEWYVALFVIYHLFWSMNALFLP